MKWFGSSWGAPVCTPEEHVATPNEECTYCKLKFKENDQGMLIPHLSEGAPPAEYGYHLECFLRAFGIGRHA